MSSQNARPHDQQFGRHSSTETSAAARRQFPIWQFFMLDIFAISKSGLFFPKQTANDCAPGGAVGSVAELPVPPLTALLQADCRTFGVAARGGVRWLMPIQQLQRSGAFRLLLPSPKHVHTCRGRSAAGSPPQKIRINPSSSGPHVAVGRKFSEWNAGHIHQRHRPLLVIPQPIVENATLLMAVGGKGWCWRGAVFIHLPSLFGGCAGR